MKTRLLITALVLGLAGTSIAVAEDMNLKEQREMLMKSNGGAMGALAKIAKGEKPYDAEVVKTSLNTMIDVGKKFPDLFPAADAVEDKDASPKIWENMADFKARSAKLSTDAEAVLAAMPADAAAVGAALGTIGANCGACHEIYKIKM